MSEAMMSPNHSQMFRQGVRLPRLSWWLDRVPLAVLILTVTFLQGYALAFWSGLLGLSGWGVSAGLEVLHLWFWYRAASSARFARAGWTGLAVTATALLLASVLHEVTTPLRSESERIQAAGQERTSLEAEALALQANLTAYRSMAAEQGRRGWQEDIRRDTVRLQAVTDQLRLLAAHGDHAARRPWLNLLAQGGVIAVAVLFQLSAVLAVWSLTAVSRSPEKANPAVSNPQPKPEAVPKSVSTEPKRVSEPVETFRPAETQSEGGFYRSLWAKIESHARGNVARLAKGNGTISQAALAADLGIKAPDLSGVKLLAQGAQVPRNPSRDAVERLSKRFGLEMPK